MQDGERRYEWNAAGRLVEIRVADEVLARYRYDHRGLRIAKDARGTVEHSLYDLQRHRVADLDAKGRILREYVWLADTLFAVIDLEHPRVPEATPQDLHERVGR